MSGSGQAHGSNVTVLRGLGRAKRKGNVSQILNSESPNTKQKPFPGFMADTVPVSTGEATSKGFADYYSSSDNDAYYDDDNDDYNLWVPVNKVKLPTSIPHQKEPDKIFNVPDGSFTRAKWLTDLKTEYKSAIDDGKQEGERFVADLFYQWGVVCNSKSKFVEMESWLLSNCFPHLQHPYSTILFFISKTNSVQHGYEKGKSTSLAAILLEIFHKWIENKKEQYVQQVSINVKKYAFAQCFAALSSFCHKMATVFMLNATPDNQEFLPYVKLFVDNYLFKDAVICATITHLCGALNMREVLIPLMAQDKVMLIEDYIALDSSLAQEFVKLIDVLYTTPASLIDRELQQRQIPDIRSNNVNNAYFKKLGLRLAKKFNIDNEYLPHISEGMAAVHLCFLVQKLLNDHDGNENWSELINKHVKSSVVLQMDLIRILERNGAYDESYEWSKRLGLIHSDNDRVDESDLDWPEVEKEEEPEEEDNEIFHILTLDMKNQVVFVDNQRLFENAISDLNKQSKIGIDAEWTLGSYLNAPKVSTLQLASPQCAYIIDILSLKSLYGSSIWKPLLTLMCSTSVLKIGYGLVNDLQNVIETLPALAPDDSDPTTASYGPLLDLQNLVMSETEVRGLIYPGGDDPNYHGDLGACGGDMENTRGLSLLVNQCLGRPLNKKEQVSDWDLRPLRRSQLRYAALDAYCLIEIHDWFEKRLPSSACLNVANAVLSLQTAAKKKKKKSNRTKDSVVPNDVKECRSTKPNLTIITPADEWSDW